MKLFKILILLALPLGITTIFAFNTDNTDDFNCLLVGKWQVYYTSDMFLSVKRSYNANDLDECLDLATPIFQINRTIYANNSGREFIVHPKYVNYTFDDGEKVVKGRIKNTFTNY